MHVGVSRARSRREENAEAGQAGLAVGFGGLVQAKDPLAADIRSFYSRNFLGPATRSARMRRPSTAEDEGDLLKLQVRIGVPGKTQHVLSALSVGCGVNLRPSRLHADHDVTPHAAMHIAGGLCFSEPGASGKAYARHKACGQRQCQRRRRSRSAARRCCVYTGYQL